MKNKPIKLEWMFIDYCVDISRSEKKIYSDEYPYQVVQAHSMNRYIKSFGIDKNFKQAFLKAVKMNKDQFDFDGCIFSNKFLDSIKKQYSRDAVKIFFQFSRGGKPRA